MWEKIKQFADSARIVVALAIPMFTEATHTTANIIITKGPCLVTGVLVSGHGASAEGVVYDGLNTNGEIKAHLDAISGTTFSWNHSSPCRFQNGIYVTVDANTTHVTVSYINLARKGGI